MPGAAAAPDDFFLAEFGNGELASRLWRGGLRADENGYSCELSTRALANAIKDGMDFRVTDGSVEALINELETCWNDIARMRRACQPIGGLDAQKSAALSVSLAKLILSIDAFQPHMITCIVNKISEFGEESGGDGEVARLLLNQLRWLDFIVDGPALCESLLSIVPVVPPPIQKAIIESLPEILDDSSREAAVTELIQILQDSPPMMGSVVDALAALGVDDARLTDVNSSILSTLPAANRDMLPVSIRYVLRTSPSTLLSETVKALRHTLALPGLGPGPGRLCLDALRSGLRMRKVMADHVVKVLRGMDKPSVHRPSDFWLLIALFDSPLHRKQAEIIFRKKAGKNMLSKALIDAALAPFAEAIGSLTERLIEIASIAVKASEVGARNTGVLLYSIIFRLFPTGNARRNVVTSLLEHTGTRQALEMDAALQSLAVIAKESEQDRSLLPHSASIQGLLDFLEFFSDSQLRQIWTILGFLCRSSSSQARRKFDTEKARREHTNGDNDISAIQQPADEDDSSGESELAMLEILLRKELTHSDMFYRRIGVLGACTMVKVLGSTVRNNVLGMLLEVGRIHPFSQALAFDELAEVFSGDDSTARETAEFIRKKISNLFEKKYISDRAELGTLVKEEDLLPAQIFGNLEDEEIEFCISISFHVRNERTLQESQDAVRVIAPNLRLLCIMTAARFKGSLSEIDAIIGAPLHLPLPPKEQDVADLSTQAKGDLLLSLFVAYGWVVELLNGYSEQESTELRAKCIKRVDNLLFLRSQISLCVAKIPLWREVIFDAYHGTTDNLKCNGQGAKDSKFGRNSKGGRISRGMKTKNLSAPAKGDEWLPFSRQLGPSALSLIRITAPVIWRFTETETEVAREGDPVTETVSLSTKGLQYLLSELASYVDGLINGEHRNSNAFGMILFKPDASGKQSTVSEATTDGRLRKFTALRTSFISLGPQLSRCVKKLLPVEEDDLSEDEPTVEAYRTCAELCLRSLSLILNSKVLHDASAEELLFAVLASIRLDDSPPLDPSEPLTSEDIHVAAKKAFKQLRRTLKEIMNISPSSSDDNARVGSVTEIGFFACCSFLAGLDSVFALCSSSDQKTLGTQFSECAKWLLMHPWDPSILRSRSTQKLIPGIVKIYVQSASNSFKTVEHLREQVVLHAEKQAARDPKGIATQDVGGSMNPNAGHFGSLTEQTSNAYTVSVLEQYLLLFKSFRPDSFDEPKDAFSQMQAFVQAELPLYSLARQNQSLLGPVMRAGKTLVDIFLKSCVPFLKDNFMEHRSMVVQICKLHQKPTRILQTFCAHSKFTRDSSLTGLVPPLRKSLELLLYKVKELMQSHNANDAFTLGNLKHRDINGEVLGSQQLQYKSDSDDQSQYGSDPQIDEDDGENDSQAEPPLSPIQRKRISKPKSATSQTQRSRAAAKGKKESKTKGPQSDLTMNERRPELDFGSDAESNSSAEEEQSRSRNRGGRLVKRSEPKSPPRPPKRSKKRKAGSNQIERRHPLIDDEAAASDDEDNEDDHDLSQFLVFGDEEEEE